MRIAVLGGTRFIGLAVVEELVDAGHEPLVVHRGKHEPPELAGVAHLHAERERLHEHADVLRAFAPEALIDTAAMTAEHATAALAAAPPGIRLVALSSMDVYRAFGFLWAGGVSDALPLDEDSPLRDEPPPDRGQRVEGWDFDPDRYEKLDVEAAYRRAGATICRLPCVYGERDYQRREEFILRRVRAGRTRIPMGPGAFLWSRGHVRELARALRLCVERDLAAGQTLNLCEATCAPIALWAQQILAASGHAAELVQVPEERLPADMALTGSIPQHVLASPARARLLLGWEHGDPARAVARSVRWHLEHPPADAGEDFSADDVALA